MKHRSKRVVSLLPTATEMLHALGAGRNVVGRSEHCADPPSVRKKPVVVRSAVKQRSRQDARAIHRAVVKLKEEAAHQFEVRTDLLQRLRPDWVVTQTLCNVCAAPHGEVEAALRQIRPRPRVVSVRGRNLAGVFSDFRRLGRALGRPEKARQVTGRMKRDLAAVRKRLRGARSRPRVWCCEWLEPLMAAGHWIPEMVKEAGGRDGLGAAGANSKWLTWESVRAYDPEVILVMPCSYTIRQSLRESWRLTRRPGWKEVSAVREGRVYAIDTRFFHHAGPRLIRGIEFLAHLFHPERVPGGRFKKLYRPLQQKGPAPKGAKRCQVP